MTKPTRLQWDHWTEDGPEQYTANGDDEGSYVVRPFKQAAHDGDPALRVADERQRYRQDCWSLAIWHDDVRKGGLSIFSTLDGALFAAQDAEDAAASR